MVDVGSHRRDRARILIIEDNPDAAESLAMILELFGYRALVALEGTAGFNAAHVNPPDVMIVDIQLPGIDGYELARRVRKDPLLKDVVLIALTGRGSEEDRREAFAAGFNYHLVKPVDLEVLNTLIAQLQST